VVGRRKVNVAPIGLFTRKCVPVSSPSWAFRPEKFWPVDARNADEAPGSMEIEAFPEKTSGSSNASEWLKDQ
jgi:hypothetical protein